MNFYGFIITHLKEKVSAATVEKTLKEVLLTIEATDKCPTLAGKGAPKEPLFLVIRTIELVVTAVVLIVTPVTPFKVPVPAVEAPPVVFAVTRVPVYCAVPLVNVGLPVPTENIPSTAAIGGVGAAEFSM